MSNPFIPLPLSLAKMLSMGAVSMKSMVRNLFSAITAPFSHHLPENQIFSYCSHLCLHNVCIWATTWPLFHNNFFSYGSPFIPFDIYQIRLSRWWPFTRLHVSLCRLAQIKDHKLSYSLGFSSTRVYVYLSFDDAISFQWRGKYTRFNRFFVELTHSL